MIKYPRHARSRTPYSPFLLYLYRAVIMFIQECISILLPDFGPFSAENLELHALYLPYQVIAFILAILRLTPVRRMSRLLGSFDVCSCIF